MKQRIEKDRVCPTATSTASRRGTAGRIAVVCAVGAVSAFAALPAARAHSPDSAIEGVWRVTRHGVNCQSGQVLATFPAIMAFEHDGGLTGYAVGPGSTPAQGSPDFGTWQREHGHDPHYSFRFLAYNYDTNGAFSGTTEVNGKLKLNDQGTAFAYNAAVKFFDASGGPLFTACGAATGIRF